MNSRQKGARGERQWRDELRANGYEARRGQQFSGSPDSPDVVCRELDWIHFEVKRVAKVALFDWMEQAANECGGSVPVVAHRTNGEPWLVTLRFEDAGRFGWDGWEGTWARIGFFIGQRLSLRRKFAALVLAASERVPIFMCRRPVQRGQAVHVVAAPEVRACRLLREVARAAGDGE